MDILLSALVGLGLAAACGFRVFVPVFILSLAAHTDMVHLGEGWSWLASTPALVALGTASVLEIAAYWIPWLDHALDVVATPAAVVAGTIVAASQMAELGPMLKWSAALIAGGGAAAAVQTATVAIRGASTALTGGIANPVVSTAETAMAGIVGVGAVVVPAFAVLLLVALVLVGVRVRVNGVRAMHAWRSNTQDDALEAECIEREVRLAQHRSAPTQSGQGLANQQTPRSPQRLRVA